MCKGANSISNIIKSGLLGCFIVSLTGAGFFVQAEYLLSKQEYIQLCIDTFGADAITQSVCEQEYIALVEKEKELLIEGRDDDIEHASADNMPLHQETEK